MFFCRPSLRSLIITLTAKVNKLMATVDDLVSDVAAQKTVIDGLDTLLANIAAQIAALKSSQTDPDTAAKIDALHASVTENTGRIQADIVANTPSDTAPQPAA